MKSIQAVKIEKIVFKGLGLAHSNNETLFVQQTIPGDILDVNIINQKKNSILAEPKKFHQKSKYKSKAKCEVFGKCGGCDWLDVEYHHQLKLKRDMLVDLFSDIVDESAISEVIPSPQRTNYRNKVFQPVQKIDGKIEIGMFEKRSHKVIQHRNCYLQPDFFDKVFADVKEYLIKSNAKIYDEKNHQGNVRHLGIRNSKNNNEFILIIVTKNRKLAFTKQLVKSMTEKYPNLVGIVQNINS
ncbi:MAG: hypothetical protein U9N34_10805, partial [Candidatus Cloacimonadota bacterium]|nr:hypothetical protein [Candidatus Cloacimonadota bacterium]